MSRGREENLQKYNGIQGILFTCPSNREREAKREVVSLLDEFVEDSEKNIELLGTQSKGWFFVRIKVGSPNQIVKNMIEKFGNDAIPSTRYLYKMFPILVTCHAKLDNISKASKVIIDDKFAGLLPNQQIKKYMTVIKLVTQSNITQKALHAELGKHIKYYHVVDYVSPDIALFVIIFRNVCCIGLIDEYTKNGKYDINRLREKDDEEEAPEGEEVKTDQKKKNPPKTKPIILEKDDNTEIVTEFKSLDKPIVDVLKSDKIDAKPDANPDDQPKKKVKRDGKAIGGINLF
jgi:hypothetical protein